jgi:hypothetical protein
VAPLAWTILLVRLAESFWLVTPAFRGGVVVTIADLVALAGLVLLMLGLWLGRWLPMPRRVGHVVV